MAVAEKRSLRMHEKLLFDVIRRQAGSLHKAILEGVMNGIEAKASEVNIACMDDNGKVQLVIWDDGQGISSREEIENFFETFGTPHSESENKIWAQFRMGRGQLFSFGKNVWRTSTFEMTVDIKNDGLEYHLKQDLPHKEGCHITIDLYENPFNSWTYNSEQQLGDHIKEQIEFMSIPVIYNNIQLNMPPTKAKWDFQDENAYYKFGVGSDLSIYNLGAFVKRIPASIAGTTGLVVSKKQLKVNFARTDIQSDCEVWGALQKVIVDNRVKKTRKSYRRLQTYEKIATLREIRDACQDWNEFDNIGLLETSSGKSLTLATIKRNRQFWTFAPAGNRMADKLIESDAALCISQDIVDQLNYTGELSEFFFWLTGDAAFERIENLYRDFADLTSGYSESFTLVADKKLTVSERRILKVLTSYDCWDNRTLCIGNSDHAAAWTDGASYIAIDRHWLKKKYLTDANDCSIVIMTLCHELAHDIDTTESHIHGEEFYRNFHNIVLPLGEYNSPARIIANFYHKMKESRIEDQKYKEIQKQRKSKEKRDKSLGIATA